MFCQRVLAERESLEADLARLRGRLTGAVRFATIYSVGLSEVTGLRREFLTRHPDVELAIEYLRPERVYDAVISGRADAGVVSYPASRKELEVIPWRQEEMVVAVSPTHNLAQFPTVHPAQLNGQDFIAFDGELPIARHIDRYLKEQRVSVHKLLHFDNIDSLREVVARGLGAAIVPKPILRSYVEDGRILALPLIPKGLKRPLAIIYRRRHQMTGAPAAFLDLLRESAQPSVR
jgi:DNA-binding transcriptional LysR family regulator